ncbi:MAG: hypothetical protein AAF376_16605 [Pseudomonadota bacterium]
MIPVVLAGLALFAMATFIGMIPAKKLIDMNEAQHELRVGSANYLRRLAGWSVIGLWILATWFFATILGDWGVTGDFEDALERSYVRLLVLVEIAIALAEAD